MRPVIGRHSVSPEFVHHGLDENGTVIASVPDVPGTMTVGAVRSEALSRVHGALVAMLAARIEGNESIPQPSRPARNQKVAAAIVYSKPARSIKTRARKA